MIVASITKWDLSTCVETQGTNTRSNRAMKNIENHLSEPLIACDGPSVPDIQDSSSKDSGHVQAIEGSSPML